MLRYIILILIIFICSFLSAKTQDYDVVKLTNSSDSKLIVCNGIYKIYNIEFLIVQGIIVKIDGLNVSNTIDISNTLDIFKNTTSGVIGYFKSNKYMDSLIPLPSSPLERELLISYKHYIRNSKKNRRKSHSYL